MIGRLKTWNTAHEQDQARVSIRIMEKEYVIACPYEERTALLDTLNS